MQRIRVKKDRDFIVINYRFLKDKRLSLKAKGLMTYMLSLPENWKLYVEHLTKEHREGKTSIYSALKELRGAGYLHMKQNRKAGKIQGTEYVLHEIAPHPENQDAVKPNAENEPLYNIDSKIISNIDNNIGEIYPPDLNREAWSEWCDFRSKEYRMKYKRLGESAAIKKLVRISKGDADIQKQIIQQSIENGWKGLFEIKQEKQSKVKQTLDSWQEARNIINNE